MAKKRLMVTEQDKARHAPKTDAKSATADKPVIDAIPGDLHWVVREAEDALIKAEVPIFQRGGQLIRPAHIPMDIKVAGVTLTAGMLIIEPVNKAWLAEKMNEVAIWRKPDERKKGMRIADCPVRYAEHYLAKKGEWNVRVLTGIVEAPTLRRDGSLLTTPGYDPLSGLYLNYSGKPVEVLDNPTRDDALKALEILREPLEEFPFVNAVDESVALSYTLTGVIRRTLRTAPFHAIDAPTAGSGKGLLVDVSALISTGRPVTSINQGGDPFEDEKRIGALVAKGVSTISIDNIERPIEGEFICSLATQETVDHRILGTSTTATLFSNTVIVSFTGNNLMFKGDMTRRVLLCRIDPQCERPDEREFKRNLHTYVKENRHRLLSAALTILRAYICAGSPAHSKKPYGSFEQWDSRVRGALLWLDLADPLASRDRIVKADPVIGGLRALVTAWYEIFENRAVTVHEVIAHATPSFSGTFQHPKGADLHAALLEIAPNRDGNSINPRTFSHYLRKHADRVVGNYRIENVGNCGKNQTWRVFDVSGIKGIRGISHLLRGKIGSDKNIEGAEFNTANTANTQTPLNSSTSLTTSDDIDDMATKAPVSKKRPPAYQYEKPFTPAGNPPPGKH